MTKQRMVVSTSKLVEIITLSPWRKKQTTHFLG